MFLNLHYSQNSQIYFKDEIVLLLYNTEVVHENLSANKFIFTCYTFILSLF